MDFKEHPPLSEPSFYILLSLTTSAKHGYAIIKDVRHLSDGRVKLATGTLYTALRRMLREGLIERTDVVEATRDNRERKFYRITPPGTKILRAETRRMKMMSNLADELVPGDPI